MKDAAPNRHRPEIPVEFAGKWIAWDAERTRIVASGDSYGEARDKACSAGEASPVLQRVPHHKVRSILAA